MTTQGDLLALSVSDAGGWAFLIASACASVGGLIVSVINAIIAAKAKRHAEEAAYEVKDIKTRQVEQIVARDKKLDEIREDIKANTKLSETAFNAANNVNEKIANLHQATLATAAAAATQRLSESQPSNPPQ